jgi:AcrR family transcriptional regulator
VSVGNDPRHRKKRGRAAHLGPERRRPDVLDAALAIAEKEGVRAVTMEAVASALGVTKPVVYACYASREELVTALLEREEERLVAGVMSALPRTLDFVDPEKMFADGFEALLTVVSEHPSAWELVLAAEPDPAVSKRYGHARERVAARVAELMKVGLAHAGTKDVARKLPVLVELFMSSGDAAVRAMVRERESWTPKELGAFVGRVILGALRRA